MPLTHFTVVADYDSFSGGPVRGSVAFTPLVTGVASGYIPDPVQGRITNGVLAGLDGLPIRLVCDQGDLHLVGELQYRAEFYGVTVDGVPTYIDPIPFTAPTSDVTVDLTTVVPATGQPTTPQLNIDGGTP